MPQVALHDTRRGFITMSVVIVLIMIGASATLFVLILSWNTTTSHVIDREGAQASWYAEACLETALSLLGQDPVETSTQSFEFARGECRIHPISPTTSESFVIRSDGTSGSATGRAIVTIALSVDASSNAFISIVSRSHVIDF